MPAWEYYRCRNDEEVEGLGREGWELVAVVPGGTDNEPTYYFKRLAHDFREEVTMDQKEHYYKLMGIRASSTGEGDKA